jgi:hypothetical protein
MSRSSLNEEDCDDGLPGAGLAADDGDTSGAVFDGVLESADDMEDCQGLIVIEGFEGRVLVEIVVLDLVYGASQKPFMSQLFEDVAELPSIGLSVVVVGVSDSVVSVDDIEGAVTGEKPNEMRLKVKAGRLVEPVIENDPDAR